MLVILASLGVLILGAIDYTLVRKWQEGLSAIEISETVSAGSETRIDEALTVPCTDTSILLTCDVSQVKGLYMNCDQDVTLEFNSSSSPAFTIALKKNKPIIWSENCGLTNPLTADITALYATIASVSGVSSATLQMRILFDPTV